MSSPTVTEFLAARYAEDWSTARDRELAAGLDTSRETRDIDAKRAILALHPPRKMDCWQVCTRCRPIDPEHPHDSTTELWPCQTLRVLTAVYSDHPEFDKGWLT
jgi:hypothetical protein